MPVDFVPKGQSTVGPGFVLKGGSQRSPVWGLRLKGFLSSRIIVAIPFGLEANQGLALGQVRLVP